MFLKLYYDLMSQPCRALWIFMKQTKIPFEPCAVALIKGEHLQEQFKKINPFQRVPVIHHEGFRLTESVAIFRYLTRSFEVPDHWYPKDSIKQAKVDEYMEWQHFNTRRNGSKIFRTKCIDPLLTGKPVDEKRLKFFLSEFQKTLDYLENVYLKEQPFLCGDQISVADLLGVCEVEQPLSAGYDVLDKRATVKEWMEKVRGLTQPHYDEAHAIVRKFRAKI